MVIQKKNAEYLSGQFLVAMPGMPDPRFAQTVIYLCAHNSEGAMGLVVNRPMESVVFPILMEQLDIKLSELLSRTVMLFGGPVESDRGFVLHSTDYFQEATMKVDQEVALTGTIEILRDIAAGDGPQKCLVVLGYSGWGPGQLDDEIKANGWLHVKADSDLLFNSDPAEKWQRAMNKIGVDPLMLSDESGHA